MPCYNSVTGWQSPAGGRLTFGDRAKNPGHTRLQLPCGQCIGCRLESSRQQALRCVLESRQHTDNCFITLTYTDELLPQNKSLDKTHLQKFFDRMRKRIGPFRYFACGEYGDETKRAHYHACLFGKDFPDKLKLKTQGDYTLYTSQLLDELWGYGHCSIGDLTFESAAYCARYVLKKRLTVNKNRVSHFTLEEETGELIPVEQPFALMSKGLAKEWLTGKTGPGITGNHRDIYNVEKDFLVIRGKKMKPAKYFDRLFEGINPERLETIREKRKENRKQLSLTELRAHEKITRARIIKRQQV